MQNTKTELVPAPQLAKEIGIHRRSLARWLEDEAVGLPKPTKIRSRLFFRRDEIEAWKAARVRSAFVKSSAVAGRSNGEAA